MWQHTKRIIQEHQNFVITTHLIPDGDGMGAACGLSELLLLLGKKTRFVSDSLIPRKFSFLDPHVIHETYDPNKDYRDTEVVVILDTHDKRRIGRAARIVDLNGVITICIDHHPCREIFTPHNVIDGTACSVGAMIYSLFKEYKLELTLLAAKGIYTSVICDTGRFSYASTNDIAHRIAQECLAKGVDPEEMHRRLYQQIPINQLHMLTNSWKCMETYYNNRVATLEIHLEDYDENNSNIRDIENIHQEFLKSLEEVECVALFRELPDKRVRISLRSKTDLDIGLLMRSIGGGGHSKAAGVTLSGSLKEAKKCILKLLAPISSFPSPIGSQAFTMSI